MVYKGERRNGKRHGRGTCIDLEGNKYEGEWQNGKRHGKGTYVGQMEKYEGEWQNGKRHGKGAGSRYTTYTIRYTSRRIGRTRSGWTKYDGEWQDDKEHGTGTYTEGLGRAYKGEWQNGKRHGTVIFTDSRGNKYEQRWENGQKKEEQIGEAISLSTFEASVQVKEITNDIIRKHILAILKTQKFSSRERYQIKKIGDQGNFIYIGGIKDNLAHGFGFKVNLRTGSLEEVISVSGRVISQPIYGSSYLPVEYLAAAESLADSPVSAFGIQQAKRVRLVIHSTDSSAKYYTKYYKSLEKKVESLPYNSKMLKRLKYCHTIDVSGHGSVSLDYVAGLVEDKYMLIDFHKIKKSISAVISCTDSPLVKIRLNSCHSGFMLNHKLYESLLGLHEKNIVIVSSDARQHINKGEGVKGKGNSYFERKATIITKEGYKVSIPDYDGLRFKNVEKLNHLINNFVEKVQRESSKLNDIKFEYNTENKEIYIEAKEINKIYEQLGQRRKGGDGSIPDRSGLSEAKAQAVREAQESGRVC